MLLFFFFQAEDGIRDLTVTGVQTCAFRSPHHVCPQIRDYHHHNYTAQEQRVPQRPRRKVCDPNKHGKYPSPGRQREKNKRSEEHTSELQSQSNLVCRLLLEKKKQKKNISKSLRLHHRQSRRKRSYQSA